MKAFILGVLAISSATLFTTAASLNAQDAGMVAAQQAMQASQQAMQAAQQANQQAMQDAQQANQQAAQDAQNTANQNAWPYPTMTREPKFSADSGRITAGTQVRITSPTHYAAIYYTTNGWSPTLASKKYTGPITIERDTVLQAIAIAPNMTRSFITRGVYTVPGTGSAAQSQTVVTDGVLKAGTNLELAITTEVDSSKVQVGDKLLLHLDQDIAIGDKVVIPKGTIVEALVTQADPPGRARMPGDIVFTVESLAANGITIPLKGGETMEGPNHINRTVGLMMIPVVGPATLLAHGDQAVIKPGMTLRVTVAADTSLMVTAASR